LRAIRGIRQLSAEDPTCRSCAGVPEGIRRTEAGARAVRIGRALEVHTEHLVRVDDDH
jgi:hypothetical protein